MRSIGRDLSEEEVTPYHVMAYNIHIDPNDNTAVPPIQCPKRDSNMVSPPSIEWMITFKACR